MSVGVPKGDRSDETSGVGDTVASAPPPRRGVGSDPAVGDTGAVAATVVGEMADAFSLSTIVGTTLAGRYAIARKIGQGGMGAVFEATHTLIGKKVAVKVLLDKYARRDAIVARLEQEARLASSIGHEHIIDITDFGQTEDGRTYVVMELLDGESLAECLAREGRLPEARILAIAAQVASALAAAHAKGIVHRDVKPENIFLLQRGDADFIKVVDFGISKSMRASDPDGESPRLTQTGMVLGTPLYMSPEQARGDDDLDHRIDVYALGVVMYEAATGKVPHLGSNYLSVISQVLADEVVPPRTLRPELSKEFEAIVLRALEKDRGQRYADADAMRADLLALRDDPDGLGRRAKIMPPKRATAPRRGLRMMMWIASIAVLVAALSVTMVWMLGDPPRRAPVAAAGSAAVVVPPPVVPDVVAIPIASSPAGATIYDGDRVIGVAPTTYRATARDTQVDLVARLPGFVDASFTVNPLLDRDRAASDPVQITLRAVEVPAAAGSGSAAPATTDHKRPRGGGGAGGTPRPGGTTTTTTTTTTQEPAGGGDLQGNPYRRHRGSGS